MLIFIFLITFSSISAQTIVLIDTQTGKPIKNVNVFVGNNGTTTDNYGYCNLDIFKKSDGAKRRQSWKGWGLVIAVGCMGDGVSSIPHTHFSSHLLFT